jgi:branched-chain amino acid transport system substrate-binding protein
MPHARSITAAAVMLWAGFAAVASAQTAGVTDTEIRIGTIQDLSGPIVQLSKQTIAGLQMRIEQTNTAGGVNGRQIRLSIEDHGYDPKKSVLAAQKLIEQTGIFAMIGLMGSPTTVATLPVLEDANVLSLFPLTAHVAVSEPKPLRWAFSPHYDSMIRLGIKELTRLNGYKTICILYQDDDYGQEVLHGATAAVKDMGMALKETTTYKRAATDFSSQVAKLHSADCGLVVLGAILREPPLIMSEARKIGWTPDFLSSSASHTVSLPMLGGKDVEGFNTMALVKVPYADDDDPAVRDWAKKFTARFGYDPDVFAVYGWEIADLFINTAQAAGRQLTTQSYIKTMQTMHGGPDMFGASYAFSATDHQGWNSCYIARIKNGRWVGVTPPDSKCE